MVDKKALPNMSARMDVDPCKSMNILACNTWYEGNLLGMKLMCYPVDGYSEEPRIAEDNLIIAARSRVSFVGCSHILSKDHPEAGQLADKLHGFFTTPLLTVGTG